MHNIFMAQYTKPILARVEMLGRRHADIMQHLYRQLPGLAPGLALMQLNDLRDLVAQGVSARSVVSGPASVVGGGGGGDDEVAQAGGPRGDLLAEALDQAGEDLRALLAGL